MYILVIYTFFWILYSCTVLIFSIQDWVLILVFLYALDDNVINCACHIYIFIYFILYILFGSFWNFIYGYIGYLLLYNKLDPKHRDLKQQTLIISQVLWVRYTRAA